MKGHASNHDQITFWSLASCEKTISYDRRTLDPKDHTHDVPFSHLFFEETARHLLC